MVKSSPDSFSHVRVHASCGPDAIVRLLDEAWRTRDIPPRFHYESVKQARSWLDLHKAHSPATGNKEVVDIYRQMHTHVGTLLDSPIQLVALGPGGGSKETCLMGQLGRNRITSLACIDVSQPLALISSSNLACERNSHPVIPAVADFNAEPDIRSLAGLEDSKPSLFTFYGMLPNLPSFEALSWLRKQMHPGDKALISANLSPMENLEAGTRSILHQYDNRETKAWLSHFLRDHEVNTTSGDWIIEIEKGGNDHVRIEIRYRVNEESVARGMTDDHAIPSGTEIRLLYSNRHSPSLLESTLKALGLKPLSRKVDPLGQEGVFLVEAQSAESV